MFERWMVCVFDDAGVSVSERCLKGVKIVRWWVLCSQITASDKAQEKHWLYRYLSSAPYLRCEDVSLSKQRTFQRQVSTLHHKAVFKPSCVLTGPTWPPENTCTHWAVTLFGNLCRFYWNRILKSVHYSNFLEAACLNGGCSCLCESLTANDR